MQHQVKQNIKGVTLLEIVVVLAIIGVISSIGIFQFTGTTSAKRSLATAEGVKSIFVNASTQINRGEYPYVRIEFGENKVSLKGIRQSDFGKKINAGELECTNDVFINSASIVEYEFNKDNRTEVSAATTASVNTVCFSKGGKYFENKLNNSEKITIESGGTETYNWITICAKNIGCKLTPNAKTALSNKDGAKFIIKFSRFGIIQLYRLGKGGVWKPI